jgi:hypothetical protein
MEADSLRSDGSMRSRTAANLLLFTPLFRQADDRANFRAPPCARTRHNEGRSQRHHGGQQQDCATVQHLQ